MQVDTTLQDILGYLCSGSLRKFKNNYLTKYLMFLKDLEDDDEDNPVNLRQVSCTMPVLSMWYADRCKVILNVSFHFKFVKNT